MSTKPTFDQGVQTFRGMRDYFGDDARWRLSVIQTIRESLELFGFEPLETPAVENERTLSGKYGEEGEKKRFKLSLPFPQQAGLRYDQTVPLARFMAMNWNRFPLPYRRYVIGPVWRDESGAGRLKQFTQCDFDTVGSTSPIIDAEIVAINYTILSKLGFSPVYKVRVNDRQLLDAMAQDLGITNLEQKKAIFRAWDKLEKADRESVRQELETAKVDRKIIQRFDQATDILLSVANQDSDAVIRALRKQFKNKDVETAINKLEILADSISDMGVPETAFALWPLLARGLDYYTGPIFETVVNGDTSSITGGGRFDELIAQMGGPDLPASGSSFGLERVMAVMESLSLRPGTSQATQVLVTIFNPEDISLTSASYRAAAKLRLDSINTEVYTGTNPKLGSQLNIALRKSIPLVVIIGPDEIKNDTITIKDLRTKNQQTLKSSDLSERVKQLLS